MQTIFDYTYQLLMIIANFTGFTYKEINIIIWFIIIPLSWIVLLDKIYKQRKLTIIFLLFIIASLLLIPNFTRFCDWLFQQSVNFLNLFNSAGSNYVASSVIICVLIPIIIYVILIRKAFFKKSNN
ncbi:hypothetical protein [uncultured Kordia sp.]|uniref:hypothetical protein n=1 Tax=uncultured Kordia sp. TaxID=507699 RepID=UPI0026056CA8|nr:hypothetical protein [uncultured Kordia sp.]